MLREADCYRHFVPTGRACEGCFLATDILSLRDGREKGGCLLPTFCPYGTVIESCNITRDEVVLSSQSHIPIKALDESKKTTGGVCNKAGRILP